VQVLPVQPTTIGPSRRRSVAPDAAAPAPFEPELLLNASVALPRLIDAIRGARLVVNVSLYGWLDSGSGATLLEAVEQKAREGVEVNVMVDGRGSMYAPMLSGSRVVARLRAAGANVVVNDSLVPLVDGPVDHGKSYSIDGRTGFLGGMNLSKTYDGWNDAMVTLDQAASVDVGRDFLERWVERGGSVSAINQRLYLDPANRPAPGSMRILANHPGQQAPITDAYLGAIAAAKQRIWVETPFLGSQAMVDALIAAARRGVDVRLLTNGLKTNDAVPGANLLGAGFYAELMRAGVKVYQQEQMTHSKILLADDTATIGSFNLTTRSAGRHFEISAQSASGSLVRSVSAMFDAHMGAGYLVTDADLRRPSQRLLTFLRRSLHLQY
jgi:cardiolipin synthase